MHLLIRLSNWLSYFGCIGTLFSKDLLWIRISISCHFTVHNHSLCKNFVCSHWLLFVVIVIILHVLSSIGENQTSRRCTHDKEGRQIIGWSYIIVGCHHHLFFIHDNPFLFVQWSPLTLRIQVASCNYLLIYDSLWKANILFIGKKGNSSLAFGTSVFPHFPLTYIDPPHTSVVKLKSHFIFFIIYFQFCIRNPRYFIMCKDS